MKNDLSTFENSISNIWIFFITVNDYAQGLLQNVKVINVHQL